MSDHSAQRARLPTNVSPTAPSGRRWFLPGLFALVVLFAIPAGSFALAPGPAAAPAGAPLTAHVMSPGGAAPVLTHLSQPLHAVSLAPLSVRSGPGAFARTSPSVRASEVPRPLAGSTASNFLAANYTEDTSIASTSTNRLLDAYDGAYQLISGSSISTYTYISPNGTVFTSGLLNVARSNDNGTTWSDALPGLNSTWTSSSDTSFGSINVGPGTITADGLGNAFLANPYYASCVALGNFLTSLSGCNSTVNQTAPTGIAVSRSTTGGASWQAPAVVQKWDSGPIVFFNIQLGGCGRLIGNIGGFGNQTADTPQIAMNPTNGYGVVTWAEQTNNLAGKLTCNATLNQYFIKPGYLTDFNTYTSTTTNGGVTWSAPVSHGYNQTLSSAVAIGPAPYYYNFLAYMDYHNATSTGIPIAVATSNTNGTTWPAAADIPGISIVPVLGLSGTASAFPFGGENSVQMAADSSATSTHKGNVYVVWNDNRSTNNEPSIELTRSTNHGTTWSAATYLTPQTTSTLYVEPTITVAADGSVWVEFYAINAANGNYRPMGVVSHDGGITWSAPFTISDTDSLQPAGGTAFGSVDGITSNAYGVFPAWADCRDAACVTGGTAFYEHYAYVANLQTVGLNSTVANINESVTALGSTSNYDLTPALTSAVWEAGASITVSAAPFAPDNASYVWSFSHWAGISTSTQNPVIISPYTAGGSSTLTAVYNATPGAWIAGYVGPVASGLAVTVNSVHVLLSPHNATTESFNITVPAGPAYTTSISAAGLWYIPYSEIDPTTALHTVTINRILARTMGYINGTLTPTTGTVTVNGTTVPIGAGGAFSDHVVWGDYAIIGNLSGFTGFSQNVTVAPYATVGVTIALNGAVISGTVSPGSAVVQIDGAPITVASGIFTSAQLPQGNHLVTSTVAGYSLYRRMIHTVAGQTTSIQIQLTNQGWINGTISPSTARVELNNRYYSVVNGMYNISVLGGQTYEIKGVLTGYDIAYNNATVSPGNVSYANLTLKASTGHQTQGCVPGNSSYPACLNTGTKNNATLSNNNLYLYLGIGLVAVVVIALAAVMLMRRGRGGSGSDGTPPEAEQTYDGSDPSQLPKLQSDGTMEGPPPEGN